MNDPSLNIEPIDQDTPVFESHATTRRVLTGKCPKCGGKIADSAAEGLCQKCLLMAGLDFEDSLDSNGSVSGAEPEPAALGRFGDFRLLEEIARGGMGIVYRAHQVSLNRIVAVKMILSNHLASEEDIARFYAEATAAAQLEHPNIVPIFEVGEIEGQHYYVMPFIAGESLATLLAEQTLSTNETAKLLAEVADAVDYAHKKGVIHRDLKPANILIDDGLTPKITDFGLAKMVRDDGVQTIPGRLMGTPGFMSPEQACGEEVSTVSDIYSLGSIMYTAYCKRAPFVGESPLDVLIQVKQKDPVPPRVLVPKLARDLETICLKCLEKNPQRRYGSGVAVADELRRFLNGEPIHARPLRLIPRLQRWCHRNPTTSSLLGVIILLVVVGLAVVLSLWQKAEHNLDLATLHLGRATEAETNIRNERNLIQVSLAEAEENLYLTRVSLAQQKWYGNHVFQARKQLSLCPPELRDWEWHYLNRLCHLPIHALDARSGAITAIDVDPTSSLIASGYRDGSLRIWSLEDYSMVHEIQGHSAPVSSVCFSHDGKLFASSSVDRTSKVWSVDDAELQFDPIAHGNYGREVVNIPNTTEFACLSYDGLLRFIDWQTGEVRRSNRIGTSTSIVAFDESGQTMVVNNGTSVKVFSVDQEDFDEPIAHIEADMVLVDIAISPAGDQLVVGGGIVDPETIVFNLPDGTEKMRMRGHKHQCLHVGFSDSGDRIITTSRDKSTRIWDAETGELIVQMRGHGDVVYDTRLVPARDQIVSASADGTIQIWHEDLLRASEPVKIGGQARILSISPLGDWIATTSWIGAVTILDAETRQEVAEVRGGGDGTAEAIFSSDQKQLYTVATRGGIHVFDTTDWSKPAETISDTLPVQSAVLLPDDDKMLVGCTDGRVCLVQLQAPFEVETLYEHERDVRRVAVSKSGRYFATINTRGKMIVWDNEENEELHRMETRHETGRDIEFNPNADQVVTCGSDGTIRFWELETGELERELHGHSFGVASLTFHPTRKRMASGGFDHSVIVWDLSSDIELLNIQGHRKGVHDVQFSADGKFLESVDFDGIWLRHEGAVLDE